MIKFSFLFTEKAKYILNSEGNFWIFFVNNYLFVKSNHRFHEKKQKRYIFFKFIDKRSMLQNFKVYIFIKVKCLYILVIFFFNLATTSPHLFLKN